MRQVSAGGGEWRWTGRPAGWALGDFSGVKIGHPRGIRVVASWCLVGFSRARGQPAQISHISHFEKLPARSLLARRRPSSTQLCANIGFVKHNPCTV